MSEQAIEAAPAEGAEAAAKAKKGPNKLLLPLVVALTTIAGGLVGVTIVAPKLIARAQLKAGLEAKPGEDKKDGEGKEGEKGKGEKGPIFKIDNLIVNPSGSQGSRFLMVSIAIETANPAMEEQLRGQEPQIRDVVISLLEKQTMESLSVPGIRDSLKEQLSDTITTLTRNKNRLRVFLPQFVIQ